MVRGRVNSATVAVVGPTAVGKSALAIAIAESLDGEIVNADSMQGYIGMDIVTAKPTTQDRQRVPHHVIDVWDPREEISVVEFRDAARAAIDQIASRGRTPIVVGGSWLYVQAIVDEMDFPPTDQSVRDRWQARLEEIGSPALHDQLRARDPEAAAHIEPTNGRRIVRALEVIELTGSFTARLPTPTPWRPTVWCGLDAPRPDVDRRIHARVDHMWEAGVVAEVHGLRDRGVGRTAAKAVGYEQICRHLDGDIDAADARSDIARATITFARRQQRRFRQDSRITWFHAPDSIGELEDTVVDDAVNHLMQHL